MSDDFLALILCWPNITGACEDEHRGHYCTKHLGHRGRHRCSCLIGWAADRALEAAVRCYVAFYSTPAVVLHHNAPDQPNPHITTRRAAVAACLPAGSPWRAVAAANGGQR